MKLSDVCWTDLKEGQEVLSYLGTKGRLSKYEDASRSVLDEQRFIVVINWENGKLSRQPHSYLNSVTLHP